ncbi:BF3164 family lipoprotein [Mucilaginibacter gilvus]|uniref:TolB-like 6-blade propeller-like n=1 Tax=Mucilaginibacter gilvus TaxID=2305909 RepID=A0A3S3XCY8_9SPHI|nr:BF3164 family lipoprotein [Mucilaginibacter gilvus]RWY55654.1 hypothetical protein EPL05_04575 [Mucilaginibacter gilvus]
MKKHAFSFFLLYTAIYLSLFSCHNSNKAQVAFNARYAVLTDTLTPKSFKLNKNLRMVSTGIKNSENTSVDVIDTFLICKTLNAPKILNVYGQRSKLFLGALINRGEEPGQCLGIANILPTSQKGIVWLFDITLGKLVKINLPLTLKDTTAKVLDEIVLAGKLRGAKSVTLINDSTFAACSYYYNDYRYFVFNKTNVLFKAGELPPSPVNWPSNKINGKFAIDAIIYNASLLFNSKTRQAVAAYNKTDRLEFYKDNQLVKIARGIDLFDPTVDFKEEGENLFMPVENTETRYAYIHIAGTDQSLYALNSSGNAYKSKGNRILTFSWDGKPEAIYKLDANYSGFAVAKSMNTTTCYALRNDSGEIYVTTL